MSKYAALIDPSDFGTIADYLRSPATGIDWLLHVKSFDLLAPLAEALDHARHRDTPPWSFPERVEQGLADGSLRVTGRIPLLDLAPHERVEIASVPRQAGCHVLYCPPFYLIHTPGLFEGTLIRAKTENKPGHELHPTRGLRMKL